MGFGLTIDTLRRHGNMPMTTRYDYSIPRPNMDTASGRLRVILSYVDLVEQEFAVSNRVLSKVEMVSSAMDMVKVVEPDALRKWPGIRSRFVDEISREENVLSKRAEVLYRGTKALVDLFHNFKSIPAKHRKTLNSLHMDTVDKCKELNADNNQILADAMIGQSFMMNLEKTANDIERRRIDFKQDIEDFARAISSIGVAVEARPRLSPDAARREYRENYALLTSLGAIRTANGVTRLKDFRGRDEVLLATSAVLRHKKSVGLGERHDTNEVSDWLSQNIPGLKAAGAKFVMLEIPHSLQPAIDTYLQQRDTGKLLAAMGSEFDFTHDQDERHGAMFRLLDAAGNAKLPVICADADLRTAQRSDVTQLRNAPMAQMHDVSVKRYGGPGLAVYGAFHASPIEGVPGYAKDMVSIMWQLPIHDLPLRPGHVVLAPWGEDYVDPSKFRDTGGNTDFGANAIVGRQQT